MGDGETFEETLLRADMLPRLIARCDARGWDTSAAAERLERADRALLDELIHGLALMPMEPSILDHVRAGEWEAASEKAKDALGLPDTVRVFVVPESAVVSIDGVVVE